MKSKFKPRIRKPGEELLAEDWNGMQNELKDDLGAMQNLLDMLEKRPSVVAGSGVASHGIYVQLDWDVTPHVLLSWCGTVKEGAGIGKSYRCYTYDISSDGFSIYAKTEDGEDGVVNWLALGVL